MLILFFDNDLVEVHAFTSKSKALEFIASGWIEMIINRDEGNIVQVILAERIKSGEARSLLDKMDEVFAKDRKGNLEEIFSDDRIDDKRFTYYKRSKTLKEINATHENQAKKLEWSVDHAAIANLQKKIASM